MAWAEIAKVAAEVAKESAAKAEIAKKVETARKAIEKSGAVKPEKMTSDKGLDVSKELSKESPDRKFDPRKRIEVPEETIKKWIDEARGSKGTWDGEVGNSLFRPEDKLAQNELGKVNAKGIEYRRGEADFKPVSEATVRIEGMTESRVSNFGKADMKCADYFNKIMKDNRTDWTARSVREYRKANKLSWHERFDMCTMDLVPRSVHEACKHYGGVSECKRVSALSKVNIGGKFDV